MKRLTMDELSQLAWDNGADIEFDNHENVAYVAFCAPIPPAIGRAS